MRSHEGDCTDPTFHSRPCTPVFYPRSEAAPSASRRGAHPTSCCTLRASPPLYTASAAAEAAPSARPVAAAAAVVVAAAAAAGVAGS